MSGVVTEIKLFDEDAGVNEKHWGIVIVHEDEVHIRMYNDARSAYTTLKVRRIGCDPITEVIE